MMANITNLPSVEILVRCDGSPQLGLGHIVRCLALATELRDTFNMRLGFLTLNNDIGAEIIEQHCFPCFIKPIELDEAEWIDALIREIAPKAIILDVRTQLAASALQLWRDAGITVAVIDDPSDRRKAADLAFYPPVPQLDDVDWHGFTGEAFVGWDYILLKKAFSLPLPRPKNRMPVLLVTMGGSDPGGLTLLALNALRQLDQEFCAKVVLGKAFLHNEALDRMLPELSDNFEILRNVTEMPSLMAGCDLAIAAFGGTAYELAALKVPSILLGYTTDHARSAEALGRAGMAISMGVYHQISPPNLAARVRSLLEDAPRRLGMSLACKALDGLGAQRISRIILERIGSHV